MKKRIFLFPGQGAQHIGMGMDFLQQFSYCRDIFEMAGEAAGADIIKICAEQENLLNQTRYTQVAMLATELCILETAKREFGLKACTSAGLSLGEYAAAVYSETITKEDGLKLASKRGIYMQEAYSNGAMAAVIGLEAKQIEQICEEDLGIVTVANYNSPSQIVISGERQAVERTAEKCRKAGALKVVYLNVSGPFHSELMAPAGELLKQELDKVTFRSMVIPYVSNVTADYVKDQKAVKILLEKQVTHAVHWEQSMRRLLKDEPDVEFLEMGPGKALKGFARQIDRKVKVIGIGKLEDLVRYVEKE